MLATTISLYLLFALVSARRCVDKYYATPECLTQCQFKMGYPGMMIGRGPWDSVISPADSSQWMALLSQACGLSADVSGSSSTVPEAAGTLPPPFASSTPTPSPFANSSVSISSSKTTALASSFFSSSASSSISSNHASSTTISTSSSSTISSQKNSAEATTTAATVKAQLAHATSTPSSSQVASTTAAAKSSQTVESPSTTDGTSTTSSSDIESYLSGHNTVRAAHGAQNLVWSNSLAASAQQWANGCLFQHSTSGENLAAGTGSSYDISAAITSWANEASSYNPNNPQPSHFTQLVWKSTTQLGCGKQMCDGIFPDSFGKALYVVCHYSPAGNVDDEYAQNVQV